MKSGQTNRDIWGHKTTQGYQISRDKQTDKHSLHRISSEQQKIVEKLQKCALSGVELILKFNFLYVSYRKIWMIKNFGLTLQHDREDSHIKLLFHSRRCGCLFCGIQGSEIWRGLVVEVGGTRLLKALLLYGSNGSGKTNILVALVFCEMWHSKSLVIWIVIFDMISLHSIRPTRIRKLSSIYSFILATRDTTIR